MAIATVVNVKGEVFAVNKDGVKRRLQKGDQLQEGEILVTAPGSTAELDMGGGKTVQVAEQQTFAVDGSVGGPAQPSAATSALESAAAAQKVIQALAAGDANALLEAEAAAAGLAGGGAADGGSSFVQLLRISEGVTPVSYDYGNFALAGADQPSPGAIEELPSNTPTILVGNDGLYAESASAQVFEAALPVGSNSEGDGEFVLGQFLVGDPDGINTLVSVTINGVVIPMGSLVGTVIPGAHGTLTITGFDPNTGLADFTYQLTDVTTDVDDVAETDIFSFTTTDGTNTSNTATVTIDIVDDVPDVQEFRGEFSPLVVDDTTLGSDTEDFSGLFTTIFGADGPAATDSLVYSLGIASPGVDSGVIDTATGEAVMLVMNNGVVEGRTEDTNQLVFTISVDAETGEVTLDQVRAVQHDQDDDPEEAGDPVVLAGSNLVTLTLTATDGDGDEDSEIANIGGAFSFLDDGPSLTVTADAEAAAALAVELDESEGADLANAPEVANGNTDDEGPGLGQVTTSVEGGLTSLFTVGGDFGADGEGTDTGTLSFVGIPGTGLATNLSATDGGAITLFLVNGVIVGRDADGDQVLTIAIVEVDGEPQLQTTLYEALHHGDDDNLFDSMLPLLLEEGTVQLQYEVTREDADGDKIIEADQIDLITTQTSAFSFDDDGLEFNPINTVVRKEVGVTATSTLNLIAGADGISEVKLTIAGLEDGDQIDALTSGGEPVYYRVSGDGFEGYTVVDGQETVIFTVAPDMVNGSYSGTYTVSITGTLDGAGGTTLFDLGEGITGGNSTSFFLLAPDVDYEDSEAIAVDNTGNKDDLYAGVDPATGDPNPTGIVIHLSAFNNNGTEGNTADDTVLTVNSSAFSLAVGAGQSIGVNDVLVMEFTQASSWLYDPDNAGDNDEGLYSSGTTTYEPIDNLTFELFDFSEGEIIEFTMYRHLPNGTREVVDSGTITASSSFIDLSGSAGMSVSLLQGMTNGTDDTGLTFNFNGGSLSGSYDTIEFSAGSGDFKVGAVSIVQITEGSDQSFEVTATATDGDGDVITDTFDITLDGNDGLIGGSGDDAISGGTGSDTISGGAGNDQLTGGAGGDTFQWTLGDEGTGATPAVDVIADFGNGTDKIDLRDLLQGEHDGSGIDASNLSSYLVGFDYVNATNSTIVNVSTHGDGVVDQQIVLAAVDITNQGALSDATIIANLLSQQKLVVDS